MKQEGSILEKMKLLLVDDEERYLKTTSRLMEKKGSIPCPWQPADRRPWKPLKNKLFMWLFWMSRCPAWDGNETLKVIKQLYPLVEVVMLTGHATVDSAIDGLKSGGNGLSHETR